LDDLLIRENPSLYYMRRDSHLIFLCKIRNVLCKWPRDGGRPAPWSSIAERKESNRVRCSWLNRSLQFPLSGPWSSSVLSLSLTQQSNGSFFFFFLFFSFSLQHTVNTASECDFTVRFKHYDSVIAIHPLFPFHYLELQSKSQYKPFRSNCGPNLLTHEAVAFFQTATIPYSFFRSGMSI
jgi:hypothetical protein